MNQWKWKFKSKNQKKFKFKLNIYYCNFYLFKKRQSNNDKKVFKEEFFKLKGVENEKRQHLLIFNVEKDFDDKFLSISTFLHMSKFFLAQNNFPKKLTSFSKEKSPTKS